MSSGGCAPTRRWTAGAAAWSARRAARAASRLVLPNPQAARTSTAQPECACRASWSSRWARPWRWGVQLDAVQAGAVLHEQLDLEVAVADRGHGAPGAWTGRRTTISCRETSQIEASKNKSRVSGLCGGVELGEQGVWE